MASRPMPAGVKAVGFQFFWAGPDPSQASNVFEWGILGSDGHVYHYWFKGGHWNGPEVITAGINI